MSGFFLHFTLMINMRKIGNILFSITASSLYVLIRTIIIDNTNHAVIKHYIILETLIFKQVAVSKVVFLTVKLLFLVVIVVSWLKTLLMLCYSTAR